MQGGPNCTMSFHSSIRTIMLHPHASRWCGNCDRCKEYWSKRFWQQYLFRLCTCLCAEVEEMEPGVFVIIIPQVSAPAGNYARRPARYSLSIGAQTQVQQPKVVIGSKGAQIKAIMEQSGKAPKLRIKPCLGSSVLCRCRDQCGT